MEFWIRCHWCGGHSFLGTKAFEKHCQQPRHIEKYKKGRLEEIGAEIARHEEALAALEEERKALVEGGGAVED